MKVKNDHRSNFSVQTFSFQLLNWVGKFTAMIILHFHLQPQFKYVLFHVYFTSFHSMHGKIWTRLIDLATNWAMKPPIGRASNRYRGGHGFESRWSPDYFRLLLSNCLSCKIYGDDHSSLSKATSFVEISKANNGRASKTNWKPRKFNWLALVQWINICFTSLRQHMTEALINFFIFVLFCELSQSKHFRHSLRNNFLFNSLGCLLAFFNTSSEHKHLFLNFSAARWCEIFPRWRHQQCSNCFSPVSIRLPASPS